MPHPDLDLPALRAVAEAAAQEEWTITEEDHFLYIVAGARTIAIEAGPTDATHIATFDPPTALALLDRIDALEKAGFALSANQCHAGYAGEFGDHNCREVDDWKARAEEAEAALADAMGALKNVEGHLEEMRLDVKWHPIGDCPVLNQVRRVIASTEELLNAR